MIRAIWQVSGGPASRSYADVFLNHGVALIGPGDAGAWSRERYAHDFSLQGFVGRFAEELATGDVLLLRTGVSTISAVGLVASDYRYLEQFDDVNGWDLQHARRARWCRLAQEHTFSAQVFGASPTRCSRVLQEEAIDFAERFLKSPPTHWQTTPLPELPAEEPPLDQARGYVEALGLPRDVIVTDGIRYRMYAGERGFAPVAYANLARLKQPAADLFARMQRP